MTQLILASSSQNRIHALTTAKIPFTSVAADIDEKAIQDADLNLRQIKVAKGKVEKVATTHQGVILGLDGVNICQGQVLEKPIDRVDAIRMLKLQSGQKCSFLTGFYLLNTQTKQIYQGTSESFYTFRNLSLSEIEHYVDTEPVFTWAAAFSPVNSMALTFITEFKGSFSNFCFSMPFDQLMPIFNKENIL